MKRLLLGVLAAIALPAIAASARAVSQEPGDLWRFLTNRRVAPCAKGSAGREQAIARLAAFDRRIDQLADTDPLEPARHDLYVLLKSECFAVASESPRIPDPDSTASLKRWWKDGGFDWLDSLLGLPRLGTRPNLMPHVVVPPDTRPTLTLDDHRNHDLKALLCAAADATCGAETRGWVRRAEEAFGRTPSRMNTEDANEKLRTPEEVSRHCAAETKTSPARDRYRAWRYCVEDERPLRSAMPIGRFKAPRHGWFLIGGRRGHYGFCDGIRAYNLETGAALVFESCSNLHLLRDGSVNREATDAARQSRVIGGSLPLDNLREAVWMIVFRNEVTKLQVNAEFYPLPADLTPDFTYAPRVESSMSGAVWGSTAQTLLAWRWIAPDGPPIEGTLTWPNSFDPAETHAASLLGLAEDGLSEGCVKGEPPQPGASDAGRATTGPRAEHREWFDDLDALFRTAGEKWAAVPRCR